jgi:hypothetical protein
VLTRSGLEHRLGQTSAPGRQQRVQVGDPSVAHQHVDPADRRRALRHSHVEGEKHGRSPSADLRSPCAMRHRPLRTPWRHRVNPRSGRSRGRLLLPGSGRGRTFESCRAYGLTKPFLRARTAEGCTIRTSCSASASTREADESCSEGARGEGLLGRPDGGAEVWALRKIGYCKIGRARSVSLWRLTSARRLGMG